MIIIFNLIQNIVLFIGVFLKMKEVEIKVRDINKEEIVKKILDLGAEKIFSGKIIDIRYDSPDKKLSNLGKVLRVRKKGNHIYLNYKGKKLSSEKDNIVDREEIGVRVSNFSVIQKILDELGYIKIFELVKYRTEYRLKNVNFDIDEYIGLNPLLEIEAETKEEVEKYIKKLKIEEKNLKRLYMREIIQARKNYNADKKKSQLKIK